MSAFMCSDRHLTALAAYAVRNDLDVGFIRHDPIGHRPNDLRAAVGAVYGLLARENMASLDARYPGDKGDAIGAVDPRAMLAEVPLMHVIKACHCYAYQACEHTGWETSRAKRLIAAIESHAVTHLPGYDAAPWGL